MKLYLYQVLLVVLLVLSGCSAKSISYSRDGIKVKYTSINFLTFSGTKDIDAQFDDSRLRVGSAYIQPDPESIKAAGEAAGEAGKVLLTP